MSQIALTSQIDPVGTILFGDYRPGSILSERRRGAKLRIRRRLQELRRQEIETVPALIDWVTSFYGLLGEREDYQDGPRSRRLKENRSLATFERYQPSEGQRQLLVVMRAIARQIDACERQIGHAGWSDQAVVRAARSVMEDRGLKDIDPAVEAIRAYLIEVKQKAEVER